MVERSPPVNIMPANTCNNILDQLKQHPRGMEIKKLLLLKLEAELNHTRGVIGSHRPHKPASPETVQEVKPEV